jgi:hypothetical protein
MVVVVVALILLDQFDSPWYFNAAFGAAWAFDLYWAQRLLDIRHEQHRALQVALETECAQLHNAIADLRSEVAALDSKIDEI